MHNLVTTVIKSSALVPIFLLLSLPTLAKAESVIEQLKNCARTADNTARTQCYEALGKQVLDADEANETSSEQSAAAPAAAKVETTAAAKSTAKTGGLEPLPGNAGGGKFSQGAEQYTESYSAVLSRCQRASDRKWFYVFENGQIWKQVDSRKLRHKNCSGPVTIVKDGFGYKMQMADIKGQVRIRRHK